MEQALLDLKEMIIEKTPTEAPTFILAIECKRNKLEQPDSIVLLCYNVA